MRRAALVAAMAVVGGASLGFLGVALTHICHEADWALMNKGSRQKALTCIDISTAWSQVYFDDDDEDEAEDKGEGEDDDGHGGRDAAADDDLDGKLSGSWWRVASTQRSLHPTTELQAFSKAEQFYSCGHHKQSLPEFCNVNCRDTSCNASADLELSIHIP